MCNKFLITSQAWTEARKQGCLSSVCLADKRLKDRGLLGWRGGGGYRDLATNWKLFFAGSINEINSRTGSEEGRVSAVLEETNVGLLIPWFLH